MSGGTKFERFGDWDAILAKLNKMTEAIGKAMEEVFDELGQEGENKLKAHLEDQDLGWDALSPAYLESKSNDGYGSDTLIRSRKMYDSITYKSGSGGTWMGIPEGEQTETGQEMSMIAAVHEFGAKSVNIDPRPLYAPTMEELKVWLKKEGIVEEKVMHQIENS